MNYFREINNFSLLLFKFVTSYISPSIVYLSPLAATFETYLNERLLKDSRNAYGFLRVLCSRSCNPEFQILFSKQNQSFTY